MNAVRTYPFFIVPFVLLSCVATAQTALPPETPQPIVEGMRVIDQYRAEVDRRTGNAAAGFSPLVIAPPRTSITPDAPERDPFEVSPRLRESTSTPRVGPGEGMTLSDSLRLRAVVRGPDGGVAKIESGKDTLVVRDGDELNVNDIRYTVTVEADGVMLRGAGAPQYKLQVR
ncbi:MAG: hypothetical protein LBI92_03310 [Azoarcus sp.]|jgi:hypothetical protein|nr:hypothetical protein [Azoarcus sp.]